MSDDQNMTTTSPATSEDGIDPTFRDYNKVASAFGQMNCLFFVLGFTMNCLVAYTIKKKGIKSPVDVCTVLISMSNWLTVFLDLFVGISYIHNHKPMAFRSYAFAQFWGFLKVVNHEWLAALLALLVLSNLMKRTKLLVFFLAMAWLIIECLLLAIPFALGTRFQVYSFTPHPFPDHGQWMGMGTGYIAWLIIVEVIPYLYFYLVTLGLLLANTILYSNMKQGYVEATQKEQQDTLTVMSYATFYLITDSPEVMQHFLWILVQTFMSDCYGLYPFLLKIFYASLFINTIRAAAYPMVFFFSKYGMELFILPARKIGNVFQVQKRYRRFYEEDEQENFRYNTDLGEVTFEGESQEV